MRAAYILPLSFSLLFTACGGGGGEPTQDKTRPGGETGIAPAISVQPVSQSVPEGAAATFSVGATGTALSYQWRRDGQPIQGATSSTYSVPAARLDDRGSTFSVVVSNAAGAATSQGARLTVSGLRLLAGSATAYGSADGTGAEARFHQPFGVAVDGDGNVFTADFYNQTIRLVTPEGKVSTLAGLAGAPGQADGSGSAARFAYPTGVALDVAGNLYVADSSWRLIRKVSRNGDVSTVTQLPKGTSKDGNSTGPFQPSGIAVDSGGNLYVTNGVGTRRIAPDLSYTILEGEDTRDNVDTSIVPTVRGVALDASRNVYVGSLANTVMRISPLGSMTMPGTDNIQGYLATDSTGNVYVADNVNYLVRKITPTGEMTTIAGNGIRGTEFGAGLAAALPALRGIAVGADGVLYVASGNAIIKIYQP